MTEFPIHNEGYRSGENRHQMTADVVFVYEKHVTEIRPEDLPEEFNLIVFEETNGAADTMAPERMTGNAQLRGVLDKVIEQNASIATTDIAVPRNDYSPRFVASSLGTVGLALFAGYLVQGTPSRREMLTGGVVAAGAALVAWKNRDVLSKYVLAGTAEADTHMESGLSRIVRKTQSEISKTTPNDIDIYFRNVVNALKLQNLDQERNNSGDVMVTLFGHGHTALEDYVKEDPHILREFIIDFYSEEKLREIIELNDSVEAFCTTYIAVPDKQSESGWRKESVTDNELVSMLNAKISL